MALNLNIPTLKDDPIIIAETRPQKISQSLEALFSKNPLDIASHLHSELEILNRQKVSPKLRIQALDTYRPVLISTVQVLAEDFTHAALPLHEKAKLAAAAVESLWNEFGYGYKLALLDLQNQLIKIGVDKSSVHVIQRAMHAISERALIYYQTYISPPGDIWSDLHQLYFCAIKLGIQNVKLELEESTKITSKPITNIEDTYKHALLMSLADPQHLTQRNIRLTADYLAFHVEHAKNSIIEPIEITTSCFIVNLSSNKPPVPYSKQKTAPNPDSDILLQTLDLVIAIHQDLNTLQNGQLPIDGGVPLDANRDEYVELLTYLIKRWGMTQKRIFNRAESEGEIEVVTGIHAIHYFSSMEAKSLDQINPDKTKTNSENIPQLSRWHITNISPIGMSAYRHPSAEKNIRIGALLGFKTKNEMSWSIGIVRWACCGSRDRLNIGVQIIAPYAQSAMALNPKTGHEKSVLLLPEIPVTKQAATIVARVGTYEPELRLSITYNDDTYVIMLTKIVERTHLFEHIQYNIMN